MSLERSAARNPQSAIPHSLPSFPWQRACCHSKLGCTVPYPPGSRKMVCQRADFNDDAVVLRTSARLNRKTLVQVVIGNSMTLFGTVRAVAEREKQDSWQKLLSPPHWFAMETRPSRRCGNVNLSTRVAYVAEPNRAPGMVSQILSRNCAAALLLRSAVSS